jgi:hypothetical protein
MPRGRKDIAQDGEKTQFSSDNQPESRGRKPSVLSYIKGSGLSLDDYRKLITNLIWEYDHKELAALLKDKNNKIPMGMTIVLGALLHDQEKRNIDNYEKFMDRCFGKSTQRDIIEFSDLPDAAKDRLNRIFGDTQEKSENIKPKAVSKKSAEKKQERRKRGQNED